MDQQFNISYFQSSTDRRENTVRVRKSCREPGCSTCRYPAAGTAAHATFLIAESKWTLGGFAEELAVPANEPTLRIAVEQVGIDVRFGADF